MKGAVALSQSQRERWRQTADWLVVALAASLPWSTTATLIIAALWLIALLPTIEREDARAVLASPAAWLVLALIAFGAVGMLWADVPFRERIKGFDSYLKLFAIPLLFIQFRAGRRADRVLYAFVASCTVLLVFAVLSFQFFDHFQRIAKLPGVPVKDYISQSAVFSLAAMICFLLSKGAWDRGIAARALGFAALGVAFLLDISFLISSRTALLSIPVLLIVLIAKMCDWKKTAVFVCVVILATAAVALTPSTVRDKLLAMWTEVEVYQADNSRTSAGERLEFWKKSIGFISEAPVLGHGTGSIRSQFERVAAGQGTSALVAANPHNQTFAVGIQLGITGIIVLYAMWLSHLLLFRGHSIAASIGALVVVQNMFGSLFNSHLFDFTHGWLYVVGVGVAGGVMMARRDTVAEPALTAAAPS